MNERGALEQRFEYKMKPLVLALFLVVSPVALFFGFLGVAPLFGSGPYILKVNDDIFTGTYAIFLGIVSVGFSIAWLAMVAFMFRQEGLCSKEVVLGTTKIHVPLTVAGDMNKTINYEQFTRTYLRSSDEGPDFVIVTNARKYIFEGRKFASLKEFELFCATIKERRASLGLLDHP